MELSAPGAAIFLVYLNYTDWSVATVCWSTDNDLRTETVRNFFVVGCPMQVSVALLERAWRSRFTAVE